MHFKKILSASILASALIFCIPQAIYAAPDAKTETPVTYGWNSDALGRFFLTENGSRATGFCSIDQKVYYFQTKKVGGMKEATLREMLDKKPEKVVELAVKGMLPKGPLGRQMYTKLHVYAGPEHEQAAQKPEVLTF